MANSKRKCKYHGNHIRDYIVVNNMAFCSFEFAAKWGFENKAKGAKIRKKENNKAHKQRKAKFYLNDVQKQHKLTQTVFNRLRVLQEIKWFKDRDLEPECISCGKKNMDWCCGHFKTRGSQGNLRYVQENTYLQCNKYCNKSLSGNINGTKKSRGYIQGLKDRFGLTEATKIIDFCESETKVRKWTGQELQKMRAEFNVEIKKYHR